MHGVGAVERRAGEVTALVAGEGGGSKRARAETLGTPILHEEQFVAYLEARGWKGT